MVTNPTGLVSRVPRRTPRPVEVIAHAPDGPASTVSRVTHPTQASGGTGDTTTAAVVLADVDVNVDRLTVQRVDRTLGGSYGGERTGSVTADVHACIRHGSPSFNVAGRGRQANGPSNDGVGVIDSPVMWLSQSISDIPPVSYLVANVLETAWRSGVLAVLVALCVLACWLRRRALTKRHRAEKREHRQLAGAERVELQREAKAEAEAARVADLKRLRNKYPS
jgi:hypothetical protein